MAKIWMIIFFVGFFTAFSKADENDDTDGKIVGG
jgi:hypothetical protein